MDTKEELIKKLLESQKQLMHSLGRFEMESWAGMDLPASQLKSLFLIAHFAPRQHQKRGRGPGRYAGNVTGVVEGWLSAGW
jgi:hypothetical protein